MTQRLLEPRTHRRQRRLPSLAAMCAVWIASTAAVAAAADPEFIGDFMNRKDDWKRLIDVTVHLEGRYASISSTRMSLQNCDLTFRANQPLVKPKESDVVEVIGHLTKDGNDYRFVVNRLADMSSELDRYERMVATINPRKPEQWHEVGAWLKKRGDFYGDKQLLAKAQEAFRKELDVELAAVAKDDLKGRLQLADKVTKLGLDGALREAITHDAYYEQWKPIAADIQAKSAENPPRALSVEEQKKLQALTEQMARDLVGSNLPLTPPEPELAKNYLASPVKTYQQTPSDGRQKLHRILYAEALQALIVQEAQADPAKGYAAAEKIEKQLPEYVAVADRLRLEQLAWERLQVATFTRRQVLELVERYKERKQTDDAKAVLTEWLDIRRERLRADDAGEHIRLAEDYLILVEGEKPAAELLVAAYKLTPEVPEIGKRLTQLGLVHKNDEWIWTKDLIDPKQQQMERAIREGRVEVGMTRQQIRRSLGAPSIISRVRSLRSVSEVWMFRLSAASMLAVQFGENPGPDGPIARSITEVSTTAFTYVPEKKPAETRGDAE